MFCFQCASLMQYFNSMTAHSQKEKKNIRLIARLPNKMKSTNNSNKNNNNQASEGIFFLFQAQYIPPSSLFTKPLETSLIRAIIEICSNCRVPAFVVSIQYLVFVFVGIIFFLLSFLSFYFFGRMRQLIKL